MQVTETIVVCFLAYLIFRYMFIMKHFILDLNLRSSDLFSDCGTTMAIANGLVNFTNVMTTFGQTLPIVCNKGYKLSGGSSIRCEVDGEWKTTATCEIISAILDYLDGLLPI